MREGDVLLVPLPQADGSVKNRPTVLLREMLPYGDVLVCGISTQLHQQVAGFDDLIVESDSDFHASGLRAGSLVRLGFLAVVPKAEIIGSIGSISEERHHLLLRRLSDYLVAAS